MYKQWNTSTPVVGFDPGGTTGIAIINFVVNEYNEIVPVVTRSAEAKSLEALIDFIKTDAQQDTSPIFVVEKTKPYMESSAKALEGLFTANQMIGAIKAKAYDAKVPVFELDKGQINNACAGRTNYKKRIVHETVMVRLNLERVKDSQGRVILTPLGSNTHKRDAACAALAYIWLNGG